MGQDDDNNNPGSDTDKSIWERYTADIDKIDPANVVRRDGMEANKAELNVSRHDVQREELQNETTFIKAMEDFGGGLKSVDANQDTGGRGFAESQVDKRTAMRLRRGQMPIDARIDLHGLYQRDAKARLFAFVAQCFQQGNRCVLVITGKGQLVFEGETPDNNTPGVIKRNFKLWLAEEPYASMILKIEKAQIKDGGEGAYYILLRRNR